MLADVRNKLAKYLGKSIQRLTKHFCHPVKTKQNTRISRKGHINIISLLRQPYEIPITHFIAQCQEEIVSPSEKFCTCWCKKCYDWAECCK